MMMHDATNDASKSPLPPGLMKTQSVSQLWTNDTTPLSLSVCQILVPTSNEVSSNYKTLISCNATTSNRYKDKCMSSLQDKLVTAVTEHREA